MGWDGAVLSHGKGPLSWGDTNTAARSSPVLPHPPLPLCPRALRLGRPQNFPPQLHPIQYSQYREERTTPGLAWLQTSATWLLGGLGWG